jgi:hypothetical protein
LETFNLLIVLASDHVRLATTLVMSALETVTGSCHDGGTTSAQALNGHPGRTPSHVIHLGVTLGGLHNDADLFLRNEFRTFEPGARVDYLPFKSAGVPHVTTTNEQKKYG